MRRPRIAIVGAGIFGISCALELSKFGDVFLFEQRDDIMTGGTYGNQYRHHFGYHYPRSPETVRQCQAAESDFQSVWEEAIKKDFPAYYAIAKSNSKVSAEQFLEFCCQLSLPAEVAYPSEEFLNREAVVTCIKTSEPAYDYESLKMLAREKITANPAIALKVGHRVVKGEIDQKTKEKTFFIETDAGAYAESFDLAVNAMYGNHNLFCQWFNFPVDDLEFRLKEIVVIRLPTTERLAITVVDGPFVTIVPLRESGLFTLGDVPRSIHGTRVSSGGIPWSVKEISSLVSHFPEMKANNPFFIPLIAQAEYVRSIYTVLPVRTDSHATDARLTSVTSHGFGCWSVFEGKIVTCVSSAKKIATAIRDQLD